MCTSLTLVRDNPLRDAIAGQAVAVGGWLMTPSSVTAEISARIGFEYCCIDMQHGLIGYSDAVTMLQALSLGNTTATIRVPWNEPGIIGKVLDAGAMAVIVPMVNTAEQAEQAVRRSMYAPRGDRSSGPVRAEPLEGPEYAEVANDHVLAIPMIETTQAVENLDAILSTPDVRAIYVGPMDLGVSMGFGRGTTDPTFFDTLDHIVARCNAHGVTPGIHAQPGNITDMLDRGFRMVTAQTDISALRAGWNEALSAAHGGTPDQEAEGTY